MLPTTVALLCVTTCLLVLLESGEISCSPAVRIDKTLELESDANAPEAVPTEGPFRYKIPPPRNMMKRSPRRPTTTPHYKLLSTPGSEDNGGEDSYISPEPGGVIRNIPTKVSGGSSRESSREQINSNSSGNAQCMLLFSLKSNYLYQF